MADAPKVMQAVRANGKTMATDGLMRVIARVFRPELEKAGFIRAQGEPINSITVDGDAAAANEPWTR